METVNHTVNQIVSVASNAIWGENGTQNSQSNVPHGEEPISGVQGKGIINDPYDAGNRDGKWVIVLASSAPKYGNMFLPLYTRSNTLAQTNIVYNYYTSIFILKYPTKDLIANPSE